MIEEHEPSWRLVAIVFPAATADEIASDEVQELIRAAIARESQRLRPYERVREVWLTDEPLPATNLGKIQRGSLPSSFEFGLGGAPRHGVSVRAAPSRAESPDPTPALSRPLPDTNTNRHPCYHGRCGARARCVVGPM